MAKLGKIKHVFREKDLLTELVHPFIIKLKDTRMVSSLLFKLIDVGLNKPVLCL